MAIKEKGRRTREREREREGRNTDGELISWRFSSLCSNYKSDWEKPTKLGREPGENSSKQGMERQI